MAEPVVVSGARGPDSRGMFRKQEQMPVETSPSTAPPREGEVVFVSSSDQFRVVLWERWDRAHLDKKGRRVPERREVQFSRGVLRTSDPEEIEAIRGLRSYGTYIFEQQLLADKAKESRLKAAMDALADPEIAAELAVRMGAKSIPMPGRAAGDTPEPDEPETPNPTKGEKLKPIK